ncbi:orf23 [Streptococcus phage 858]|uniref:Orf23 n=1 Tax=Streptococcus phage 858 TaxID=2914004 RepID=B0YL73_9CAUD|nr:orf23 [Streptococcus phage 858]ABT18011.1 orf23 [Streptococcus phage 858]
MRFEYESKSKEYDASGAASATKVILKNRDGAYVPVFLPVDKIDLSNTELLKEALEVIYQENFPQRAENEKFNDIDKKIAKYDEMIEKMQASIDKSEKMTQLATATLNSLIDQMYPDEGKTANETNTQN